MHVFLNWIAGRFKNYYSSLPVFQEHRVIFLTNRCQKTDKMFITINICKIDDRSHIYIYCMCKLPDLLLNIYYNCIFLIWYSYNNSNLSYGINLIMSSCPLRKSNLNQIMHTCTCEMTWLYLYASNFCHFLVHVLWCNMCNLHWTLLSEYLFGFSLHRKPI